MHPNRRKGVKAENEAVHLFESLGYDAKRRYNLGTHEDVGDIMLPYAIAQVADWKDVLAALRQKPLEAEEQRMRAGERFAVTCLRLRGGQWRFVQTPEQWRDMHVTARLWVDEGWR